MYIARMLSSCLVKDCAALPEGRLDTATQGPAIASAECRNVAVASFGGGHRVFDDRVVYPDPDRNDETGKKLAILKGAARAANMSDEMFKAKFMVLLSISHQASLSLLCHIRPSAVCALSPHAARRNAGGN